MQSDDMPTNSVYEELNAMQVEETVVNELEDSASALPISSPIIKTPKSLSLESLTSSTSSDRKLYMKCSSKLLKCDQCDQYFSKRYYLKEHMNLEHNELNFFPFKCNQDGCDKGFDTKSKLKRHERVHSGYECDKCHETFASWSILRKHKAEQHPEKHECGECGASFNKPYFLKRHQRIHEKSDVCPIDGCSVRVCRLNVHLKKVHNTTASQIAKRATQAGDPESDRRFVCDKCMRSFKKGAHLAAHKQAVHEGKTDVRPKSFACTVEGCDRMFALRAKLEGHRNWHLGLKPFPCPFSPNCSRRFTSRQTLNKHLQTSHITSMQGLNQAMQLAFGVANVSLKNDDDDPDGPSTSTDN